MYLPKYLFSTGVRISVAFLKASMLSSVTPDLPESGAAANPGTLVVTVSF
jgi:hypothetical protein